MDQRRAESVESGGSGGALSVVLARKTAVIPASPGASPCSD